MERPGDIDPAELLALLTDVVYAVDLDGRFTYVNPAGLALLGRELDELLGQHLLVVVDESSADEALHHFHVGLAEPATSPYFEVRVRRSDGEVRDLEIHAGNCLWDGRVVGRQGVGRDITELRRLQRELRDTSGRLELIEEQSARALEVYRRLHRIAGSLAQDSAEIDHSMAALEHAVRVSRAHALGLDETDVTIIGLVSQGWSNLQIAGDVRLSAHTVKDRVARIVDRLGARTRAGVGVRAIDAGIL